MTNKIKNNYYNDEDKINFEKLDNFRKFNSSIKNDTQLKNHTIKYANSDKNYFNNILKIDRNSPLLNERDVKKDLNYYNSSDFQKFDYLNNFPEYENKVNQKEIKNINSETLYTSNDVGEFDKIIQINDKEEKYISKQNKKIKIIDYKKLKDNEKKIKNKLGIDKIKIVYFD